jgi:deazaflavin-dependent oxidoreductase (nitroreductase family)
MSTITSSSTICPDSAPHGARPSGTDPRVARPAADRAQVPASIRLLRRMNPLIRALLRSPLHGVLSRDLLVLTYRGAKSGLRRELPLSYVEHDGRLYLCTRSSVWPRNLRVHPDVELQLRGRAVAATAHLVDPESAEACDALRAFLTHNPRTGEILYDVRRDDARPREEDVVREAPRSVVVRLDLRA